MSTKKKAIKKSSSSAAAAPTTTKTAAATEWKKFINAHYRDQTSSEEITNTRIGSTELSISGGKYHIPESEYCAFLALHESLLRAGHKEYMTEKQLVDRGAPVLVDIDLHFPYSTIVVSDNTAPLQLRKYTQAHIDDLRDAYLEEIKEMYALDESAQFPVFIFEKPAPKVVADKGIIKDGIHMVIGISMERRLQEALREKAMKRIQESWADFEIANSWDAVFDRSISSGSTNWQLYGSCKPGSEPYRWTQHYSVGYDPTDGEVTVQEETVPDAPDVEQLWRLSARCTAHPQFALRPHMLAHLQGSSSGASKKTSSATSSATNKKSGGGGADAADTAFVKQALAARSIEEIITIYNAFRDAVDPLDYEILETCEYTMALPPKYYEEYPYWVKVGWALRSRGDDLFILWLAFSTQWSKFRVADIRDCYDRWQGFNMNDPKGLTRRSIMHWVKMDNYEKYADIRKNSVEFHINESLLYPKCGDVDVAKILYEFYKDQFVCVSICGHIWYQFVNHHWKVDERGTSLRKHISTELRAMYKELLLRKMRQQDELVRDGKKEEAEKQFVMCNKMQEVIKKLGQSTDKDHVMKEAEELFYDSTFMEQLDENPYLLCFNNGVYDFKDNAFRDGRPEDFLSKSTRNNYLSPGEIAKMPKGPALVAEIREYMRQLFPLTDVHDYMWEHLASTLLGNSAVQTFNMYIGKGRNGKSVLTKLMSLVLGDYKGDVPLSLITEKRVSVGGVSPEIVKLKGIRYAVMQEPSKGQRMNEGMMKQLTSGQDVLTGRAPYMPNMIEFLPQFKLVVCSNELMEIKSQDDGTWRRIRVVDFVSLFTETPVSGDVEKPYQFRVDVSLDDKFKAWKEIFLSMLVDVAARTKGHVTDCARVLASSREYKNDLDYISTFMDEFVVHDPKGRLEKRDLSYSFHKWFVELYGDKGCPTNKELYAHFNNKYGKTTASQSWKGIVLRKVEESLVSDDDDDEDEDEDEDENNK
jgi:P4 family phage/plasmid primase-like protien